MFQILSAPAFSGGSEQKERSHIMYSSAYVWAKILAYLEERMTSTIVSAYFDDAEVVELNDSHLILYSPSDFRRDIITRRYSTTIEEALKEIFNSDAKVIVFGDEELEAYKSKGMCRKNQS